MKADRRTAHLAALAILVADDVLDRRTAIEALMDAEDRQEARRNRNTAPRGQETARSLARLVDLQEMTYGEAEHTVALVLTGGTYDRYEAAAEAGSKLLSHALTRRDEQRHDTAQALQRAISEPLAADPAARQAPAAPALHPCQASARGRLFASRGGSDMTRHEEIRVEIEIDNETLEVARLTARITLLWNRLHKADPMAAMDLAAWLPSKRLVPPEFHTRTGQHSVRREPL